MKILTATNETQGARPDDFSWAIEGELVRPPAVVCDADRGRPDGGCGCNRSWAGVSSAKSTTTAVVRDLSMSRDEYVTAIRDSYTYSGWDDAGTETIAAELLEIASDNALGTVVELRDGDVIVREGGVSQCP